VVWRNLVDFDNYPSWQKQVRHVELRKGSALDINKILRFYLHKYQETIYHEEKIIVLEEDKEITFLRIGDTENPLLKEHRTSYTVKKLLDGTTEVSVTVSYHTIGLLTKIYNQLFFRMILANNHERNLITLQKVIENI
jgi:hypothetical protein